MLARVQPASARLVEELDAVEQALEAAGGEDHEVIIRVALGPTGESPQQVAHDEHRRREAQRAERAGEREARRGEDGGSASGGGAEGVGDGVGGASVDRRGVKVPARSDERRDECLDGLREHRRPEQPQSEHAHADIRKGGWLPHAVAGLRGGRRKHDPLAVCEQVDEACGAGGQDEEIAEHEDRADLSGGESADIGEGEIKSSPRKSTQVNSSPRQAHDKNAGVQDEDSGRLLEERGGETQTVAPAAEKG